MRIHRAMHRSGGACGLSSPLVRGCLIGDFLAALVGCAPADAPPASSAPPAASPAVVASPSPAPAAMGPDGEKLVEQSAETRFQLALHATDTAVARFIPNG